MMIRIAAVAGFVIVAAQTPAHAVPGWATDSAYLSIPVSGCTSAARGAIKAATGAPAGSPSQNYSAMGSLTAGYTTGTGVFVYCMAHPTLVCKQPSSIVAIVAFSDDGSGVATNVRDKVRKAIGSPQLIDCGAALNPVNDAPAFQDQAILPASIPAPPPE